MDAVNCVLAKEIALYVQLAKHSVIGNSINNITVKDSLLLFLGCTPINACNDYIYDCNNSVAPKCNITIKLDSTTSICKTPLIKLT